MVFTIKRFKSWPFECPFEGILKLYFWISLQWLTYCTLHIYLTFIFQLSSHQIEVHLCVTPPHVLVVFQLLQQPSTTTLGLILLQTTSEEMASPREDLSIARKMEVHRLLLSEVPGILSLLTHLLDRVLEKHRRLATTVTPPPSPTHGMSPVRSSSPSVAGPGSLSIFSSAASNDQILQQPGTSSLVGRLLSNSPMKSRENLGHPLPPLDSESEEISALALKCLGHLFSWIPLSTTITPSLVSTVFYLAEFGCSVVPSSSSSSVVGNAQLGKYMGRRVVGDLICFSVTTLGDLIPNTWPEWPVHYPATTTKHSQKAGPLYILQRMVHVSHPKQGVRDRKSVV